MENVPLAAASAEFNWLIEAVEAAGYAWTAMIANAAQYGSAQSRQRLLFVAVDKERGDRPEFPRPTHGTGTIFSYGTEVMLDVRSDLRATLGISPATQRLAKKLPQDFSCELGPAPMVTVGDRLGGLPVAGSVDAIKMDHVPRHHGAALLERMSGVPEGGRPNLNGRFFSHTYGRLHRRGLSRTITNFFWHAGGGRYWHPTEDRALTMREAARLQGFDDDFVFNGNSRRSSTLVGNALDASLASVCHDVVMTSLQ